jgi:hypothetical protein
MLTDCRVWGTPVAELQLMPGSRQYLTECVALLKTGAITDLQRAAIRMKLRREDGQALQDLAQLFWSTTRHPESETTSERFQVTGDGQWHEYSVTVSQNPRWRGIPTRLRLDPTNQPCVTVEVDSPFV